MSTVISLPSLALPDMHVERGARVPLGTVLSIVVMAIEGDSRTAKAVLSLLSQGEAVEVVVVNSGSASVKPALVAYLDRIVLVEVGRRLLPGATRNIGIGRCTGKFIGFLAADCVAGRDWVSRRISLHQAGALAVASALRPAAASDQLVPGVSWACYALLHVRRAPEYPPAWAARYGVSYDRSLFERHGLFRQDLRIGEDTDFNARIGGEATIAWAPDVLTYHQYPGSLGQAAKDAFRRGKRLLRWQRGYSKRPLRAALNQVVSSWVAARGLAVHTSGSVRQSLDDARAHITLLALSFALGVVAAYCTDLAGNKAATPSR